MFTVYIIIPVHNRINLTKRGIEHLKKSIGFYKEKVKKSSVQYKILVVDDGSTDGTSKWIKDEHSDIILLKGDGSLWWSGSVNLALNFLESNEDCDFVLLWNDDLRPEVNYFKVLHKVILNRDLNKKIICSKVLWNDGTNTLFNAGCLFDPITGEKKIIGLNQKDDGRFDDFHRIDWTGGMGVLIPKKIIHKVGKFDSTNFPQYHGDSDYMLRALQEGFQLFIEPRLKVYNNKDTTGSSNENLKMAFKSIKSLGSNYNLKKDIKFYKRHSKSPMAYIELIKKYSNFFLGAIRNTFG